MNFVVSTGRTETQNTMKTKLYLAIIILLVSLSSNADTFTVNQDGTGDYIIIQNAVDSAQNGDTVLVYPGIYYENLSIINKYITLGSLYMTTGNDQYIHQTVIDGNQSGTCIMVFQCNSEVIINGLTLTNGSGKPLVNATTYGGGIFIWESDVSIIGCIISNNNVTGQGGGIDATDSHLYLSSTTIKNNKAMWFGGGICVANSTMLFDTSSLCNIYCNFGSHGTDVYNGSFNPYIYNHIVVDTFTVLEPDYYYLYSGDSDTIYPGYTLSWEINNAKLEQTSQNIYVSNSGNNSNDGLTSDTPLKNIWYALIKMKSDSISPDTILLNEGTYSQSVGEIFPLSLKRDVSLKGVSKENTILDAEDKTYHFQGIKFANNYTISDLTIKNGNGDKNVGFGFGSFMMNKNMNAKISDVVFTENSGYIGSCGRINNSNNFKVERTNFVNNLGAKAIRIIHGDSYVVHYDTNYVTNCLFMYNNADTNYGYIGGGLSLIGKVSAPHTFNVVVQNCLFAEHSCRPIHPAPQGSAIGIMDGVNLHLINSTITNNESINPETWALGMVYASGMNVINSIVYNNDYGSLYMYTDTFSGENNLSVSNSLFEGGVDNIMQLSNYNNINYGESNIDTDPLFYYGPDFPYNLSANSPCIDVGTLEIPDWIEFPETDLAGNPRIYGESIDMGAYEWNPTVGYRESVNDEKKLVIVAPNPVIYSTVISVRSSGAKNMKVEVYNNNGKRVAKIIDGPVASGTIHTTWDCTENGNRLSPGIYHIVLSEDGIEMDSEKLIVQ